MYIHILRIYVRTGIMYVCTYLFISICTYIEFFLHTYIHMYIVLVMTLVQNLNGLNVYTGCCKLRISYSTQFDLEIKEESDKARCGLV